MTKTLSCLSSLLVVTAFVMAGCATSASRKNVDRAKVELKAQLKPEIKREVGWELRRDMEYTLTNRFKTQLTAEMKKEIAAELSQMTNEILIQLRSEFAASAPKPSSSSSSYSSATTPSSTTPSYSSSSSSYTPSSSSSSTTSNSSGTSKKKSTSSSSASNTTSERALPGPGPTPMTTTTEVGADGAPASVTLFNGKTLDGWIPYQGNLGQFSGADFADFGAFAKKILAASDPIASFINQHLDPQVKSDLANYVGSDDTASKAIKVSFVRNLSKIVGAKKSIYDSSLFQGVDLRPETQDMVRNKKLKAADVPRMNKMLIEDAFPKDIAHSTSIAWVVKGDALASTGEGRGVIYTKDDYSHYRLTFVTRHNPGVPDHQPSILIFCSRPADGERPLDNLGGIQFQIPNGGHWDYRPGHNEAGKGEFRTVAKTDYDPKQWCQVEIVANAKTGLARMAVAQPPGSRAVEITDFADVTAGKVGPIGLQMHNGGLLDEYKDLKIEVNPKSDELVTTVSAPGASTTESAKSTP